MDSCNNHARNPIAQSPRAPALLLICNIQLAISKQLSFAPIWNQHLLVDAFDGLLVEL
jgi:hypothetical protein